MESKRYSQLNLIQEELDFYMEKPKSFLDYALKFLKEKTVCFQIGVPKKILLRSFTLCRDIEKFTECKFTPPQLLEILVDEFLKEITLKDQYSIYRNLLSRNYQPSKLEMYDSLVPQSLNRKYKNYVEITVEMKREDGLRLEFLLDDLENGYPDHGLKVEHVLEILFCDFVEVYIKGGLPNAIKDIVKILEK